MQYITKAKKLVDCNFRVYGIGNFDLTIEELAMVLELVEQEDFKSLKELYVVLEKACFGDDDEI